MGFTRQELSLLNMEDLFCFCEEDRQKITEVWKEKIISKGLEKKLFNKIELSPILFSEKDFEVILAYTPKPNYITQKSIKGQLIKLDNQNNGSTLDLKSKIVMIENGDPGYNLVFTKNPIGLITKYGGVASHMSIRCAELGIPAAIGCGDQPIDRIDKSKYCILDCQKQELYPGKY